MFYLKISDDEDDLPMGADFLTINADPAKAVELDPMDSTRSPVINTGSNKRREFGEVSFTKGKGPVNIEGTNLSLFNVFLKVRH